MVASMAVTILFSYISSLNYPGGVALVQLHKHATPAQVQPGGLLRGAKWNMCNNDRPWHVHVGVLPAMTGVTRFGELEACWVYSKVKHLV